MSAYYFLSDAQLAELYAVRPDARDMDLLPFGLPGPGALASIEIMQALNLTNVSIAATNLDGISQVTRLNFPATAPQRPAQDPQDRVRAFVRARTPAWGPAPGTPTAEPAARVAPAAPAAPAAPVVPPLLTALERFFEPLRTRLGSVEVVDSGDVRTHGTGLRLVLGLRAQDIGRGRNARLRLDETNFSDHSYPDFMTRPTSALYEPSYLGQSLRKAGQSHQRSTPIAEMFWTQDGGVDIVMPIASGILKLSHAPKDTEIEWYRAVLSAAVSELNERDRVTAETREARFDAQLPHFIAFARKQLQFDDASMATSLREQQNIIDSHSSEYLRTTRALAKAANDVAFHTAHEATARATIEAGVARIQADARVEKLWVRNARIVVTTKVISAYNVQTEKNVEVCSYNVTFHMEEGVVRFEPRDHAHQHPTLAQNGQNTSAIDMAISESLARHDLAAAWRQAVRFLETIA